MTNTVEPRVSRGLRDLLPDQMLARQSMIDTIRRVYELYGFVPLSTPAIEYLDVLSGSAGQEAQRRSSASRIPENEALGLRFDLTVPLARVIAQYKELPRPFRRYQVSPVWRADKPDKGRFREFTQFDLDSVGTESEVADTEDHRRHVRHAVGAERRTLPRPLLQPRACSICCSISPASARNRASTSSASSTSSTKSASTKSRAS